MPPLAAWTLLALSISRGGEVALLPAYEHFRILSSTRFRAELPDYGTSTGCDIILLAVGGAVLALTEAGDLPFSRWLLVGTIPAGFVVGILLCSTLHYVNSKRPEQKEPPEP